MYAKTIDELEIWNSAVNLAEKIYRVSFREKFKKDYGLTDQIRRASVSISSNIAEGFERDSNLEFLRYLRIAKGSLLELKTQVIIANKIEYLLNEELEDLLKEIDTLKNKIGSLIKYLNGNTKSKKPANQ